MSTQFEPAGHVIGSGVPEHLGEQKPSTHGRPSAQLSEVWHRAPPGSLESGAAGTGSEHTWHAPRAAATKAGAMQRTMVPMAGLSPRYH